MDGFDASECIGRARSGDEDAARELFRQLHPLVLRLVRSHLPRRSSEEDLCQAAFMKIFANLHQYSGKVPLEHWVSRVTINTCLNQLRAEKSRPELRMSDLSTEQVRVLENLATTTAELDPSDSMASRELVEVLLRKLSPDDRVLMHLLYFEECSIPEIAARTGWNQTVIKVRAFRARGRLRQHLAELRELEKS